MAAWVAILHGPMGLSADEVMEMVEKCAIVEGLRQKWLAKLAKRGDKSKGDTPKAETGMNGRSVAKRANSAPLPGPPMVEVEEP